MVSCLVLPLPALPVCLAVVQLLRPCSAQFAVVGPREPILAMVGEDAELPCHLFPKMSAEHMELMWVRSSPRQVVHTYAHGQVDMPTAEYGGRTSILREDITAGKAVLQIRDVRASDRGTYLCYFQDGDFYATAQVELEVAGPFFGSVEPWAVALAVLLPALLFLLLGTWCFLRQHRKIRALTKEKERERTQKEAAEAEMQQQRSAKESLQAQLSWRKMQYLEREERSQAYADLKMVLFQPVDLFLDPDTAHPSLRVSVDKRSLQMTETREDLPDNPERFSRIHCVLGCESFMSGRHFWEVDVGDRKEWCVGVCRENVERKSPLNMIPKNGFWGMGQSHGGDYRGLTDPRTKLTVAHPPERVGIFLDYELGEVSFYNAINGSHIFTFPPTSFSGPLRPIFEIWTSDPSPLTICPAQKAVGTSVVPDPGPDPSLETPVSPGSAEGNGDPQAEETSLLLAAQPGAESILNHKIYQQEISTNTQSDRLH